MSNISLLPNSNWDDVDWMHHINVQQGFEELYVDKTGQTCIRIVEERSSEAFDFWLKRCREDQEEDRQYAEENGMTLKEYYELCAEEDI